MESGFGKTARERIKVNESKESGVAPQVSILRSNALYNSSGYQKTPRGLQQTITIGEIVNAVFVGFTIAFFGAPLFVVSINWWRSVFGIMGILQRF